VAAIESLAGVPVTFCSVGPARGQTVVMPAAA
jgi:adenylosuccinate synthase